MDLDVVDSLLLYIYTGRVNRSNLLGLKSAGDFFDIGDLKKLIDGELEQGNASRKTNSDCLKVKWKSIKSPMRSITHYKCHFCHFKVSIIFFDVFLSFTFADIQNRLSSTTLGAQSPEPARAVC